MACRRRIDTSPRGTSGSRQALAKSAMQTTLQSTQRLCRSQGLRSQSVNVRALCFSYSPRLHTLCRGHLRCSNRQASAHTSLAGCSPQICRASQPEASIDQDSDLVGEDAAFFDVEKQTTKSWTLFTGLLLGVLGLMYVVRPATLPQRQLGFIFCCCCTQLPLHCVQAWVDPDTGVANNFLDSLKGISSNPEVVMLLILGVFAASHSGLAYLRPWGKLHALNTLYKFANLPIALQPFCCSCKHQMQVQSFHPLCHEQSSPTVSGCLQELLSFLLRVALQMCR